MKKIIFLIIIIIFTISISSKYGEASVAFWYNMSESNVTFWEQGAYYPGINISIGMVGFDGWANHTSTVEREGNHFNVNKSVFNFSSNFSLEAGIYRSTEANEYYIGLLNTFDGVNSMNGLFFTLEGNQWVIKYNNINYWVHSTIGIGKIGNMTVELYYNLSGDNKFNVSINRSVIGNPLTSNSIAIQSGNFTNVTLGFGQPSNAAYDFIKYVDYTLLSIPDNQNPLWWTNTTNISNPLFNQSFWFSANISDNGTLGKSIFSFYNGTSWVNDSTLLYNGTINDTLLNTSKTINTIKNQNISWYWYFEDNTGNKNETTRWNYTIGNSPPIVNATILTPSPANDTSNLTINMTYFDIDGDAQTNQEIMWFNNSVNVSQLNGSLNVKSTNLTGGQIWLASVRFYDGANWSSWVDSSSINIGDLSPPSFLANWTSPTSALIGTQFEFYLNLTDSGSSISPTVIMELEDPNGDRIYSNQTMYLSGGVNSAGQETKWNVNYTPVAIAGTWYANFYANDSSGNAGNATNNPLSFTVTTSGGTTPSGGGGSTSECSIDADCKTKFGFNYYCKSSKCLLNESTLLYQEACNYNGVCEPSLQEDFVNCKCDPNIGCGNQLQKSGDCSFSLNYLFEKIQGSGQTPANYLLYLAIFAGVLAFLVWGLPKLKIKNRYETIKRRW